MAAIRTFCVLLGLYFAGVNASPTKRASTPISSITSSQWAALNQSVGGRLAVGYPLAKPCYSLYNGKLNIPDLAQCSAVQSGYTDEMYIATQYAGYQNTNWGFCQAKGQDCGLDFNLPSDPTYYVAPNNCNQGSVPNYYIRVQQVSDVQAALAFVKSTGVPLVIKNSGHDYKGRSSAPNALALWTYNVQPAITMQKNFQPEGCAAPSGIDGVTMGAGQGFAGVYAFAEANNITIVGGSSRTVGATGGWISGGGHGALSNTLGLGVDNVLQIKAVLPNGTYVTANRCQNQDIFYALRGGGGSTFGVNMEMTTTAHPQVTLQVAYIRFLSADINSINKFISLCVMNADKWATEGWGGYIAPGAQSVFASGMILMTPKLNHSAAVASMKPITDYVASLGNVPLNNEVDTSPSFYQAYNTYILPNEEKVGLGLALGSRLLPRDLFTTTAGQQKVTTALQQVAQMVSVLGATNTNPDLRAIAYGGPLQFLVTAPSSYPNNDTVPSSITPAWRSAIWHTIAGPGIPNNANAATFASAFKTAHDAATVLRNLAPNSGAYQNEADVYEPDPATTFWGTDNYNRLLSIKKQLDPNNILTCWDCIGWDSTDARYGCYPPAPS
ncbi:hypothetical protein BAUCODRAFT_36730 [Baudoinia panamericana UAMH 10762]|uniref:FAD-binding PCMH-type domain-containing protein n=1 Tax=Baudoinia panamericana (strain UAMH 10762) TaxID=717646 RepID=M2MRX9_BAUPA|nr:uncharacterized protein BAUCODRAFT_36730 [Baudoinia panamericana UAMH 10762]EMC94258.1 hypothetical protein BAUCODRAFT_36730 [Baudoinia panamericana UAMH 10762]